MNIQGIIFLQKEGFPLIENTFIFRKVSEIPKKLLESYGEEKEWAIRSFDDRMKITDNPYISRSFGRIHAFSRSEVDRVFKRLNNEMETAKIPQQNRIFIISKLYHQNNVSFTGHVYKKDHKAIIDIYEGNMPPSRDWTPRYSITIDLLNKHFVEETKYRQLILKVLNDVYKLKNGAYLDFAMMDKGEFFYRDLSFH